MRCGVFKRLLRSRRAATAVAMAILTVPLLISASAAVDFSRIALARALLQAAVDGAAIAGVGEWQMSESSTDAQSVIETEYASTGMQLPNFVSGSAPTITLACTGTTGTGTQGTNQCGGNVAFSTGVVQGCPVNAAGAPTYEYCAVVKASATLKNSLFAWLIPSELLSATSIATANFPPDTISGKNIPPSPGFGSAGDKSSIYAYAVPMDAAGNTANYGEMPPPNTYCENATGQITEEQMVTPASGVTACNYLFVSDLLGDTGSGGAISLKQNQPIAFSFVNFSGANGYEQLDATQYTTHLMVTAGNGSATYYPNGFTPSYTTTTTTYTIITTTYRCKDYNSDGACDSGDATTTTTTETTTTPSTVGTTVDCTKTVDGVCERSVTTATTSSTTSSTTSGQPLYGECPDHTLYGSLSQGFGTPVSDSLNVYSSAYEVAGEPPTHNTNHVLTPFVSTAVVTSTFHNTTYKVSAVCPNFSTANTSISAPVSAAYSSISGNQDFAGMNTFSTWFPDQPFTDSTAAPATDSSGNAITTGSGDVFPPVMSGCTQPTNATDGGVTDSSTDPWLDWSPSNIKPGYCDAPQTSSYNDCAFIVQPLGTNVPVNSNNEALLPDYYNEITDASGNVLALDPVWDDTTYVDPLTGVKVNDAGAAAGYTPGNTTATSATISAITTIYGSSTDLYAGTKYIGDKLVTQKPATSGSGTDHNLPLSTSYKCYNPSVATQYAGYYPDNSTTEVPGYAADGTPLDPVANPQDGAILCNSPTPETYALYWNDMGTYEEDDLGYWNAVEAFTCSVPAATNAGGGPATLSG